MADADESDVKQLVESRAGATCSRRSFAAAPKLLNEIFRRFFRGKLRGCHDPTANFVLQALFGATRDGDHVATALQELGRDFGSPCARGAPGSSPRRPRRVRAPPLRRERSRENLARGLTAQDGGEEGRSIAARARAAVDGPAQWFRGGTVQVLGAAMLQTLPKFPPDVVPQFVESTASLTTREATSAACDAWGSRAAPRRTAPTRRLRRHFR